MIKIVNGVVRATDAIDLPLATSHPLWDKSRLASMLKFGDGVTIAALDAELAELARRAKTLSSPEKEFWSRIRTDRDRLKRTQDMHEEMA